MENTEQITVKIDSDMSARRFKSYAADLKRWGMRFDPTTKTWSAPVTSLLMSNLRSAISAGDLHRVAAGL